MKVISLIKQHNCIQLGHLYEHLVMRTINEFFYSRGLYKALDYYAHGTTFDKSGIIFIDIGLYTTEAQALSHELENLKINISADNTNIGLAVQQIIAEEPWQLVISNGRKVVQELKQLDEEPWKNIESLNFIDTTSTRKNRGSIYLSSTKQPKPSKVSLALKSKNTVEPALRPLFYELSRLLLLTVTNNITAKYGYYADEFYGNARPLSVVSELLVHRKVMRDVDENTVGLFAKEIITEMLRTHLAVRLSRSLKSMSYLKDPSSAVYAEKILEETGILIGIAGWKQSATVENINALLRDLVLEVKIGRRVSSVDVTPNY